MKYAATFAQGLILAVIMCAIAFGVVALKYRHPALLAQLDRDHLPGFALAVTGVCLAFATVWTCSTGERPDASARHQHAVG